MTEEDSGEAEKIVDGKTPRNSNPRTMNRRTMVTPVLLFAPSAGRLKPAAWMLRGSSISCHRVSQNLNDEQVKISGNAEIATDFSLLPEALNLKLSLQEGGPAVECRGF